MLTAARPGPRHHRGAGIVAPRAQSSGPLSPAERLNTIDAAALKEAHHLKVGSGRAQELAALSALARDHVELGAGIEPGPHRHPQRTTAASRPSQVVAWPDAAPSGSQGAIARKVLHGWARAVAKTIGFGPLKLIARPIFEFDAARHGTGR